MIDSLNNLAYICYKNGLLTETVDYLVDIKIELGKLEEALELACKKLEDQDSTLFDLYDRFDTYYPTSDRHEWKEYLLESVEVDE